MVVERADDRPPTEALEELLEEAADALAEHPKDEKLRRALVRTYLEPAPTQEAAAERLGLPYSTFRRHLTTGSITSRRGCGSASSTVIGDRLGRQLIYLPGGAPGPPTQVLGHLDRSTCPVEPDRLEPRGPPSRTLERVASPRAGIGVSQRFRRS